MQDGDFEHGFVYRDVVLVLDYEAAKTQALAFAEVHVPDATTFPLRAAADVALKEFTDPRLREITAVDIPFSSIALPDPPRKRVQQITLERILRFGPVWDYAWMQGMCIRFSYTQSCV